MTGGFTFLELLVVLCLSSVILMMFLSTVRHSIGATRKIVSHQQKMEGIFHTMDMLKSDLTKCGMRLGEASKVFHLPLFEIGGTELRVVYGVAGEKLTLDALCGDTQATIQRNDFFSRGKKVLLFEPADGIYEFNEIAGCKGDQLTLTQPLLQNYPVNTAVVALQTIEYKLYTNPNAPGPLKRKVNKGYFQPLLEEVTDFFIQYIPEAHSVFYRIQVNSREQLQGYIFLTHITEVQ